MPSCTCYRCLSESPGMLGKPQAAKLDFTLFFDNSNTTSNTPRVFIMSATIIVMLILTMTNVRVKNSRSLHRTFNVEPLYLQHENTGLAIDYMVILVIINII